MATYSQRLNAVQSAMVSYTHQFQNWHGTETFSKSEPNLYCLFSFQQPPENMKKKQITGGEVYFYGISTSTYPAGIRCLFRSFNESEVNWNNAGIGMEITDYLSGPFEPSGSWENGHFFRDSAALMESVINTIKYGIKIVPELTTTIYTHLSAYVPYFLLMLQDASITVTKENASPNSGFVDKLKDATFSWAFNVKNTLEPVGQASAKFRWREAGATAYTEIAVDGSNQSIVIPANTFTADNIEWQVVVTSDDDIEGTPSDWFALTTVDSISTAVTVSPRDVMIDGSEVNRFEWDHVIDTGSEQSAYDLEYSDDSGLSWKTLASGQTSDTFADIAANTLPAGKIMWRVRTYNTDSVAGEWSDPAYVTVRSAPAAPSITERGTNARPIIRWQSVGQQSYELQVWEGNALIYESGEAASTKKEHKVTEYLSNGSYTVMVRIKNTYGLSSAWTSAPLQISQTEIQPPAVTAVTVKSGVLLQFSEMEGFDKLYLLRDGVPIQKLSPSTDSWTDYSSLGVHAYTLRGVDVSDNFADSAPVEGTATVQYATLAPANKLDDMVELWYRRDSEPTMSETVEPSGTSSFYSGRELPVYDFYEFSNVPLTWTYSYRSKEELEGLKALVNRRQTVRYRDHMGYECWCVLTNLQINRDYISRDFTLSGIQVDHVERIEYD